MPLRIPRVVLRVGPGPTWTSGLPEDQPGWDEHAAFINAQIDRGLFIMGGTWAGRLGSMSIWEGVNADGVRALMQEDPFIQNFGRAGRGPDLRPGLVIAIEPMLMLGAEQTRVLADEWTVVTVDGSLAAHFEHTVAVTEDGPEVFTARD